MNIAEQLEQILSDSLYRPEELEATKGEPPKDAVLVEGVMANFGFEPKRLESHRQEVVSIIEKMPTGFQAGNGGGQSFLNLCMTESGEQWGEHRNVEQLVVLAIGLKVGRYCLPKSMWSALPGSMPYIVFNTNGGSK